VRKWAIAIGAAFLTAVLVVVSLSLAVRGGTGVGGPKGQGPVNTAPSVIPGLRAWQGSRGTFTITPSSRIVVDPTSAPLLQGTASLFQSDMQAVTGHTLPISTGRSARTGDFFLSLSAAHPELGDEGYRLTVGDSAAIAANTRTGVFYGTRTALQILLQDQARLHIPKGTAEDYPEYKERALMLDVGLRFFSLASLEGYVKLMGWFKLNDLHLHLNDEYPGAEGPDWMNTYAAFRLNSDRFPGLAATDGSYSYQDMRELQDMSHLYGVTITPEIDGPAHALPFTQYRPDLASPTLTKDCLDLNNPDSYAFMNAVWDEFLPWFDAPEAHIGGDEYPPEDADHYREYLNRYDSYLRARGKSVRIWGSLSRIAGNVKVNTDMTVDLWDNDWQNPVDTVKQGFQVVNASIKYLYIVPKASNYLDHVDTQTVYERWEPNIFDLTNPSLNLQPGDPHLRGAMLAEWNDQVSSPVSDADVFERINAALPVVAHKFWAAPGMGPPYAQFEQLAAAVGYA
jgi:hexosaminidase